MRLGRMKLLYAVLVFVTVTSIVLTLARIAPFSSGSGDNQQYASEESGTQLLYCDQVTRYDEATTTRFSTLADKMNELSGRELNLVDDGVVASLMEIGRLAEELASGAQGFHDLIGESDANRPSSSENIFSLSKTSEDLATDLSSAASFLWEVIDGTGIDSTASLESAEDSIRRAFLDRKQIIQSCPSR